MCPICLTHTIRETNDYDGPVGGCPYICDSCLRLFLEPPDLDRPWPAPEFPAALLDRLAQLPSLDYAVDDRDPSEPLLKIVVTEATTKSDRLALGEVLGSPDWPVGWFHDTRLE